MRYRGTIKESSGTSASNRGAELSSSAGTRDQWKERLRDAVRETVALGQDIVSRRKSGQ